MLIVYEQPGKAKKQEITMCFSAGASFGASAVLGVIGTVAMVKSTTTRQRLFGSIPYLFAVQQFSEGMLWLSLSDPGLEEWRSFFTYAFLVFAIMIWPVWIPLTIRLLEKDPKRKKIMSLLLGIGTMVTIGVGCVLLIYPVRVVPSHHHLHYRFDLTLAAKKLIGIFSLLYFIATIVTPFISGIKRMKWLGIVFLLSYVLAVIFFNGFVISVWCFFAAILSIVVVWIITAIQKPSDNRSH